MIVNYQQQQELEKRNIKNHDFATISSISSDGISLIFDGETTASKKKYKCNKAIKFNVGDRVKVSKLGGSYLVEYPVGDPVL